MTPLNPTLASQASMGFQAVRGGMLSAFQIVRKREAKPKKKARAPSSDRVTKRKKEGKKTAMPRAPVQTVPAVPQGTAVPSSSFVPGFPQGTAAPSAPSLPF
ncbi:hypothetical protein CEP53_014254, partial [Fusarium sp. AF-6]